MRRMVLIGLGSIAIILLLTLGISHAANHKFNQQVEAEVKNLFAPYQGITKSSRIEQADLEGLPPTVQRWLTFSQVVGKESISTARSKHSAVLQLKRDQGWMRAESEQYNTIEQPGFIWKAKITAAPFIHIVGRDKYVDGRGNMLIKALSLATVADSRGEEIDQGSLLRYLAEIVWMPTAALSDYIQWEEIDDFNAKATMSYGGISAWGIFTINEQGEVIAFEAERYGEFNGQYSMEVWSIALSQYREFSGIKIPTIGEVTWKLADGDFNWYNFELIEMEYNVPKFYK